MTDSRYQALAKTLISYSVDLQPGENILIQAYDTSDSLNEFICCLVKEAAEAGGNPVVFCEDQRVQRALLMNVTEAQMKLMSDWQLFLMERVQAWIGFRSFNNINEQNDVPAEKQKLFAENIFGRVHRDYRLTKTKWCLLRWPTPAMAQLFGMSTEAFEDFYFRACLLDYARMAKAAEPLRELMKKTDKVRILGPSGTDLTFSIKDIGAHIDDGKVNRPGGEAFSPPVKESVNGVIAFNTPTTERGGKYFSNICLEAKNGKIIDASCESGSKKDLAAILDRDKGSRFFGEFAMAFNPHILEPAPDILFVEKVAGSLHLAIGDSLGCDPSVWPTNMNKSSVHWDLVLIQRPEYGGGEIWFDNVLIRKDGLFILHELEGLNPENLLD